MIGIFHQSTESSKLASDLGSHQNFQGKIISTTLNLFVERMSFLSLNRHSFASCQQTHGYLVFLRTTYDLLKILPYND